MYLSGLCHPLYLPSSNQSTNIHIFTVQFGKALLHAYKKENYVTWLMSHSFLAFQKAEALFYFQINGCLTINKLTLRNHRDDWRKIQKVTDAFIKAGLEGFLIRDQRDT